MARVIVVGGGIAGLTAGLRLQEGASQVGPPLDVLVLEGSDRPGGHARTTLENGYRVEAGPNAFVDRPDETEVCELVRDLGLESHLLEARPAARRRFLLDRGRLLRAPDSPPTLLSSGALSPWGKLRILLEPWAGPAPAHEEETVHQFASRRVGREAADTLVDAAVAGISAGNSRKLSMHAAFPQMVEMERAHGSLIRAMIARRKRGRSRLLGFDGGMETLVRALCLRLGRSLRTDCAASTITVQDGTWRILCRSGETFAADHVVLALPAPRAAEVLASWNAPLARTLEGIPYAGVAMVALAYRETDFARPLDGYGYLVAAREGLDTLGVVWESSLFEGRAPSGFALLRVMLGGARRPDVIAREEGALVEQARRELARPLGVSAPPVATWVQRWPGAIAQYSPGHLERIARVRALAELHPGLDVCGSAYDGVSFSAAVRSGARAADRARTRLTSTSCSPARAAASSAR